jgi:hypothetical protein
MVSCRRRNVGCDFQLSTSKRYVHKTLSTESLQLSDSVGVLELRSSVHKTDVLEHASEYTAPKGYLL